MSTKSKVYFTDFRTKMYGEPIPDKFKRLIRTAGIEDIDMEGKFVAIKIHFGELGNLSFLRPNYARALVDIIKEKGGKPFLTDCNTLYPGYRKNALEHLECAWLNGFTPYTVGCPILIGDGLKGTDDVDVPVKGGEYVQFAHIGRAVMDADIVISLNHFKGHEEMGFGGALKNLGMGCGSRAGKKDMHNCGKPQVDPDLCRGCGLCVPVCANNGLVMDMSRKKMTISESCAGCGRCIGACNFDAISFRESRANDMLGVRIAEYAKAVVDKYIKYLAAGITNTINTFQPDILCIGGGVCNEGDPLLLPMKELVAKEVYTRNSEKNTKIVIAQLGNDAGIIGAAFLGRANQ